MGTCSSHDYSMYLVTAVTSQGVLLNGGKGEDKTDRETKRLTSHPSILLAI